jgi:hypothetical protein
MSLISKLTYLSENGNETKVIESNLKLHEALTDNADWNNEYWEFDNGRLLSLSKTIQEHFNLSDYGIAFQAIWADEIPKGNIPLTISELINIVSKNKISTHSKYVVRKST